MRLENTEILQKWLREQGYSSLADLPAFDVDEIEFHKHLDEVRMQGLHEDEGSNQARALYRTLTSQTSSKQVKEGVPSVGRLLDDVLRGFRQSIAVLAGKTEAHEKIIVEAKNAILADNAQGLTTIRNEFLKQSVASANLGQIILNHGEQMVDLKQAISNLGQSSERRFKRLFWVIVIGFGLLFGLFGLAVKGHAQDNTTSAKLAISLIVPEQQPGTAAPSSLPVPAEGSWKTTPSNPATAKAAPKPEPAINLAVPESYKLRIRDVQWEQDKLLIRIQNLQMQIEQTKTEVDAKSRTIQQILAQLELENHIDPAKWKFDLDLLVWLPKEK